jgi:hypothetical protein
MDDLFCGNINQKPVGATLAVLDKVAFKIYHGRQRGELQIHKSQSMKKM